MSRPVTFRDAIPIFASQELDRSLFFYQELLGYELTYRWPSEGPIEFAYLTLAGSGLGLGRRAERHAFTGRTYATNGSAPVDLCLYVDDLDEAAAYLVRHQVPLLTPSAAQPWGERIAYVADPDGNHVLLIESSAASEPSA